LNSLNGTVPSMATPVGMLMMPMQFGGREADVQECEDND